MKLLRTIIVFDSGGMAEAKAWESIHDSIASGIESIDYPRGSKKLTLREKEQISKGKYRRNGVVYLKNRFFETMTKNGWAHEEAFKLPKSGVPKEQYKLYPSGDPYNEPVTSNFGGFDFVATRADKRFAIEWETGNISSSHRSINKLAIALNAGEIQAGIIIVPSRDLYRHLTDRIGNIGELSGYLPLWKGIGSSVKTGLLAVVVVEHDELVTDPTFSFLPVGKDGNALKNDNTD